MPETRCGWSDLPTAFCAHCRGDGPALAIEPQVRATDEPTGRTTVQWPEPPRTPQRPTIAAPEAPSSDPKVKVARDLRAIRQMIPLLDDRGEDLASDHELPGGDATLTAAPVASPSTWERRVDLAEAAWLADPNRTEDTRPDPSADETPWETPLQTLLFWSEDWRHQLGLMHESWLPTLDTEANFLASGDVLDWAWDHETRFDDFVDDVEAARTRMENVVRSGIRTTRSRILCDQPHEQPHKKLNLVYGETEEAAGYIAPCCHHRYTPDEAKRAHAKQMRSAGAERWVSSAEAIDALAVQGWQRRTIRKWINPLRHTEDRCMTCGETWEAGKYRECPSVATGLLCAGMLEPMWKGDHDAVPVSHCDIETHRVLVWWPDLWRRHMAERQRRDTAKTSRR